MNVFHVDFIFSYGLFLCCWCHFFIQLLCFSLFDEHSKCSSHFLKLCAEDPQHNFVCMMYFFTDNFLLLDKYHKSSKCGQYKLVVFIYFK